MGNITQKKCIHIHTRVGVCMHVYVLSHVQLFAPHGLWFTRLFLSMGFPRQNIEVGIPFVSKNIQCMQFS